MNIRLTVLLAAVTVVAESRTALAHESTLHLLQARLAAAAGNPPTPKRAERRTALTIAIVDQKTKMPLSGLVRVLRADGTAVSLEKLYDRGITLEETTRLLGWHVIHGRATVSVPSQQLTVEAFSGLETELASREIDLRRKKAEALRFELKRFFDAGAKGLRSANTHLHIMKLSRKDSDRYLREVPRGDVLDLLFVSHLERFEDDATYITNEYSADDLRALSGDGVLLGNGEEHRHNFEAYGEGYGHVMFLDIKELIQPVSIGPGIMKKGHDGIPLRRGIKKARGDGATAIFCHNTYGYEDVPDWISGILDAHNIFDGSLRDSYEHTFYRFLNIGLKVPFSTGTDWFIYDFSRVYVPVEGELTSKKWLRALREGRSFITNGTLLEFSVNGRATGDTVVLSEPGTVVVRGRGVGRNDFKAIEIVHDGQIATTAAARSKGGHFEATLDAKVTLDGPGWLALRIPGGGRNELEGKLFAHTSPVYVEVAGKKTMFVPEVAQGFIDDMRESITTITKAGKFESDEDREKILAIYREGIIVLEKRLAKR